MKNNPKYLLRVCIGGQCRMNFSEDLFKQAQKLTINRPYILVERRGCVSICEKAPNIEVVDPENGSRLKLYSNITPSDLDNIIQMLEA